MPLRIDVEKVDQIEVHDEVFDDVAVELNLRVDPKKKRVRFLCSSPQEAIRVLTSAIVKLTAIPVTYPTVEEMEVPLDGPEGQEYGG